MPYPASWVLFDQLYCQFNGGLLTETEYLTEKWHLDYRYGDLLKDRGLLNADEVQAKRDNLWVEMEATERALQSERSLGMAPLPLHSH